MNTKRLGRPALKPSVKKARQREARAKVEAAMKALGCTPAGLAMKLHVDEKTVNNWLGARFGMSNAISASIDALLAKEARK